MQPFNQSNNETQVRQSNNETQVRQSNNGQQVRQSKNVKEMHNPSPSEGQVFVSLMTPSDSLAPWFTLSVVLASFGLLLADRDGRDLSILMISLSIFLVCFVSV
jgi:hypothetical protein